MQVRVKIMMALPEGMPMRRGHSDTSGGGGGGEMGRCLMNSLAHLGTNITLDVILHPSIP